MPSRLPTRRARSAAARNPRDAVGTLASQPTPPGRMNPPGSRVRQTETSAGQRPAARTKLLCGAHVAPGSATGDTPGCSTTSPPKKTALLTTQPRARRALRSAAAAPAEPRDQRLRRRRRPPEPTRSTAVRQRPRRPTGRTWYRPMHRKRRPRRSEPAGRRRRLQTISGVAITRRLINRLPELPNRRLRQGGGRENRRPRRLALTTLWLDPMPPARLALRPLAQPAKAGPMDEPGRTPHRHARRRRSASRSRHRCFRSRWRRPR